MERINVRVVKLPPMRVASFQTAGAAAEQDAFQKLYAWAYSRGLLKDTEKNPLFGFDSPVNVKNKKTTGYEVWIRIPKGITPEPGINIKDFGGGIYLVLTCLARGNPAKTIPAAWARLQQWAHGNGYEMGNQQHLERFYAVPLSDDFTVDLYFPVKINVPGMTEDEYVHLIKEIDDDAAFKNLSTLEKINKLKENISKATGEKEKDEENIDDIKAELRKNREEIKNIKQVLRSLLEYSLSSSRVSPVPLNCRHVADEPHIAFITINRDGTRVVNCDADKPCNVCIYKENF